MEARREGWEEETGSDDRLPKNVKERIEMLSEEVEVESDKDD